MVDFSKAFDRQDHTILITKLSDMNVPGWLLRIVISFLTNRKMVVRYKGAMSGLKELPGGGPQGTLLGLLLFLVLINDVGFPNQENNIGEQITRRQNFKAVNVLHLKYVDDLTLLESIKLRDQLIEVPESAVTHPVSYRARTGHVLPLTNSEVYKQLIATEEYANQNKMKINYTKTKTMLFNNCKNLDFLPELEVADIRVENSEEMKILGVVVTPDLKWNANTRHIVQKAFKRMWILRRLKNNGAETQELKDVYIKQIRSILELAVPAWHPGLTVQNTIDIEQVQRAALQIMLGQEFRSYNSALNILNLESLATRREKLCLTFSKKASKHWKHSNWFNENNKDKETRLPRPKYCPVFSRTKRFKNSPISYLTGLLNQFYQKRK